MLRLFVIATVGLLAAILASTMEIKPVVRTEKTEVVITEKGAAVTNAAPETPGADHKSHHPEKVSVAITDSGHATVAKNFHFEDAQDEDESGDVALDELEAMTIASALLRKHFSPPAAVPCRWGPWKDGECSKTCGDGVMTKTRSKTRKKKHGGSDCPGSHKETAVCNKGECPPPPTPAPTPAPTLPPSSAIRMGGVSLLPFLGAYIVSLC